MITKNNGKLVVNTKYIVRQSVTQIDFPTLCIMFRKQLVKLTTLSDTLYLLSHNNVLKAFI